jgi:hypothetical protein
MKAAISMISESIFPSPESLIRPKYVYEPDKPGFEAPSDPGMPIWRYMNFTKFLSMLESSGLFFARADKLGDTWEGSLTRAEVERRKKLEQRYRRRKRPIPLHSLSTDNVKQEIENTIVSCWHLNEVESAAMWKLYVSSGEGIAIRSSFERLSSSFRRYDGRYKGYNEDSTEKELLIHIGKVRYVDFDRAAQHGERILLKRKSFKHEREIRAVVRDRSFQSDPGRPTRFPHGGDLVPANLRKLIDSVYVSPLASAWFVKLIQDASSRYRYHFPVIHSALDKDPLY